MHYLISWLLDCLGAGNLPETKDIDPDKEARMFAEQGKLVYMSYRIQQLDRNALHI